KSVDVFREASKMRSSLRAERPGSPTDSGLTGKKKVDTEYGIQFNRRLATDREQPAGNGSKKKDLTD
ncbi:MAG: hypothetical protein J7D60_11015, partial [Prosthecochloris sp.]|nr:hypothetical protein [Prosthecochloris sp.]